MLTGPRWVPRPLPLMAIRGAPDAQVPSISKSACSENLKGRSSPAPATPVESATKLNAITITTSSDNVRFVIFHLLAHSTMCPGLDAHLFDDAIVLPTAREHRVVDV